MKEDWLKGLTKEKLVVAILSGILLLCIAYPTGGKQGNRSDSVNYQAQQASEEGVVTGEDYISSTEKKLESLIGQMEGVKTCRVMLTLASSEETVLEKNVVTQTISPKVEGVVVMVAGEFEKGIRKNIMELIGALFDLESHKIQVMKMQDPT